MSDSTFSTLRTDELISSSSSAKSVTRDLAQQNSDPRLTSSSSDVNVNQRLLAENERLKKRVVKLEQREQTLRSLLHSWHTEGVTNLTFSQHRENYMLLLLPFVVTNMYPRARQVIKACTRVEIA